MVAIETPLTFTEAAKALPPIGGKRVHASTIWRWARKGCRGVILETRRYGGRFVTTLESLDRFAKALAEQPLPERATEPAPTVPHNGTRNTARREREIQQAEQEPRKRGIL
ncbi:MAG: DUF1580 domain-containing protein [Phycisphaerales bacterium]|nr:DUF1580 domain-containing protein [Phycisphaerales bacterium]